MTFNNELLYEVVQKKNNILVKNEDEYTFYDEPDIVSLGFMIAVTVEQAFSAANSEAYFINGEIFNEALFRFSYAYNEGNEENFMLQIKKEHIGQFCETYLFLKTGTDVCQKVFLDEIKTSCERNCTGIWNEYFKEI